MGSPPERVGTAIALNAGGGLSPALVADYPPTGRMATVPPPEARPHHPRRGRRGGTKVPLLEMAELAAGQDDALRGRLHRPANPGMSAYPVHYVSTVGGFSPPRAKADRSTGPYGARPGRCQMGYPHGPREVALAIDSRDDEPTVLRCARADVPAVRHRAESGTLPRRRQGQSLVCVSPRLGGSQVPGGPGQYAGRDVG